MAVPGSASDRDIKLFGSSCITQFNNSVSQYTWTIKDYKTFYNLSRGASSSIFSDFKIDGIKWRLDNTPNKESRFMCLRLTVCSDNIKEFEALCEFSILDTNLKKIYEHTIIKKFSWRNNRAYIEFIQNSYLFGNSNKYLPNDSLTVLCKITILGEKENVVIEHRRGFQKDLLLTLFEDQKFYDLTLSVGGRELHAHKAILAARSTVFSAMFQHKMEESKTNLVEIVDLDYEVVEEMLRFIYTNKISNIDKIAHNLFIAADKYALDELRFKCQEAMITNLSIENAAQYYVVAGQHNAQELKNRVKAFIEINSAKVVLTSGFQSAFQRNPELFNYLHLRKIL